ncbi:MAG: putative DNA-binding domain-containing protein [Deltaproteobacteria bacterium]|nr:putative DNA-binding domain-containing protein [Deltaproteobacteria bacterium]
MRSRSDSHDHARPSLDGLERWFAGQVLPTGAPAGLSASTATPEDLLLPSATLAADERLAIYRDMVLLRLHDSLAEDFPAVRHLMGEEGFGRLVRDYLDRFPSRSFTLDHAGRDLPRFLAEASDLPNRRLLHDVARLEWSTHRCFHAERSTVLAADAIAQIPLELWPEVRLRLAPTTEVFALDHRASEILSAVASDGPLPSLERSPSWCAVWRKDYVVWRQILSEPMAAVLFSFARGGTIAEAVSAAEESWSGDPADLERALFDWFADWLAEGFFSALELPGRRPVPGSGTPTDMTQTNGGYPHDEH